MMNLSRRTRLIAFLGSIALIAPSAFYLASCGTETATSATYSYAGPGSNWAATLNGSALTFVIAVGC